MAPPPAKKPAPSGGGFVSDMDATQRIILMVVILAVIGAIVVRLQRLVERTSDAGEPSATGLISYLFSSTGLLETIYRLIDGTFAWVSLLVSLIFAIGAIYSFLQFKKIREGEREAIAMLEAKLIEDETGGKNERWERILSLVSSENPGDWRAAIIDADVMLDELMRGMSYHGDSLGDMLKSVEKSDFQTLDLAWEAHKVRNRIAHHGSDFILTHREAKRIIDLYRQVFQEFDLI